MIPLHDSVYANRIPLREVPLRNDAPASPIVEEVTVHIEIVVVTVTVERRWQS